MDHEFPQPQSRKRKSRADDEDEQLEQICTPRQPQGLCPKTIPTPPGSPKRPRHEHSTRPFRLSNRRRSSSSRRSQRCGPPRLGNDVEDMNCNYHAVTSPSSGSLLGLRHPLSIRPYHQYPHIVFGPHLPSLYPPVNRQTLKDLDLTHVLHNPQLRHDLLFDPGLHFRPASNRKKDEQAEGYWEAIAKELQTGCTCLSFNSAGDPITCVCVCDVVPLPSSTPRVVHFEEDTITVRTPPRLRNLLEDFLDVLLMVIQPLSRSSGMYMNPDAVQSQVDEHAAHAGYIRSIFDPALIEQELLYKVFDPSGLFDLIGETLKRHCAPMRDSAISEFVKRSSHGKDQGPATSADAIIALRMCMDVLELMQLDIANHQLHCLRPYLAKSAPQFEMHVFESDSGPEGATEVTRAWLRNAHLRLRNSDGLALRSLSFVSPVSYQSLPANRKVYMSVVRGMIDLIFAPPSPLPAVPNGIPATPLGRSSSQLLPVPGFPETTFLDNSRLLQLAGDALDITAQHLYLLLFRQLTRSSQAGLKGPEPSSSHADLVRMEILDLASSRPGHSILPRNECLDAQDMQRRRVLQEDIILQVTRRASELKAGSLPGIQSSSGPSIDFSLLQISRSWGEQHLHLASDLFLMLRNRLREVVFQAVLALTFPPGASDSNHATFDYDLLFSHLLGMPSSSGLEPLLPDVRLISEKISALASVHLNTYLPLYEQDDFLDLE